MGGDYLFIQEVVNEDTSTFKSAGYRGNTQDSNLMTRAKRQRQRGGRGTGFVPVQD